VSTRKLNILITLYKNINTGKKEQVVAMFDNIAGKYDFLNHLLSIGIDKNWRKRAIKILKEFNPESILDVATGTGDFAIESIKLNTKEVIGIDI
jgi:demethylmenaquinone methyltransferase/2-methoxy-6-polyprenyl-1,4-benzoquinol methylase